MVEDIFNEVINEASLGTVFVGIRPYNIKFSVNQDSDLNIIIDDMNRFIDLLNKYVYIVLSNRKMEVNHDNIKEIICLLFTNITYDDCSDIYSFIERYINFYDCKISDDYVYNLPVFDSDLKIESRMQSLNQETPYLFLSRLYNGDDYYELPGISYGISDNVAYVYAIQNKFDLKDLSGYQKRIKRLLYKVNKDVSDSSVSPSFVVSLTIFLMSVKNMGIDNVKAISFLPVRYHSKKVALSKRIEALKKRENISNIDVQIESLINLDKKICLNMTNKFKDNFWRVKMHYKKIDIKEKSSFIDVRVSDFESTCNDLLDGLIDGHFKRSR